jgi:hypothetical protein
MQVAMQQDAVETHHLAEMLEKRWAYWIRDGDINDVKSYGIRSQQKVKPPAYGRP